MTCCTRPSACCTPDIELVSSFPDGKQSANNIPGGTISCPYKHRIIRLNPTIVGGLMQWKAATLTSPRESDARDACQARVATIARHDDAQKRLYRFGHKIIHAGVRIGRVRMWGGLWRHRRRGTLLQKLRFLGKLCDLRLPLHQLERGEHVVQIMLTCPGRIPQVTPAPRVPPARSPRRGGLVTTVFLI